MTHFTEEMSKLKETLLAMASHAESAVARAMRALVEGGADVVEVRAERTSLEQVYFEVMGVRPGADGTDGAAAIAPGPRDEAAA